MGMIILMHLCKILYLVLSFSLGDGGSSIGLTSLSDMSTGGIPLQWNPESPLKMKSM